MDHISRLSEVLYVGLCRKIGTPTEVKIRRDVRDMEDLMETNSHTAGKHICNGRRMLSGSHREGFRFETSDLDYMMWYCSFEVISDISQLKNYYSSISCIILMDDSETPPGFARLQVLIPPPPCDLLSISLTSFNDRIYVSNILWRQIHFQQFSKGNYYQNVIHHGPCSSGYIGSDSIDRAACFTCKYWPNAIGHWMERCLRHKWPPTSVLKNILNQNFHCVSIGSKCTTSENELEWRLSFSHAEQKLVYSMNHTQFICYGLLKIFLKEVINNNEEETLLCSYFMKTTLFWLIQVGHVRWCPSKLLECFWVCFKYLIHCVVHGKFPNFFIPQNNMFLNKIIGAARTSLLGQLHQYYRIGVSCLLQSPTLRSLLEPALISPSFVMPSIVGHFQESEVIDSCIQYEISRISEVNLRDCILHLKNLETLLSSSMSIYQSLTLQHRTANQLARVAFMIVNNTSYFYHKDLYCLDRNICNMLELSSRIGTISHSLYLALYYYRTGRYDKALSIINVTERRLSKPFIYLFTHSNVHRQRYREDVSGLSLSRKMKLAWVTDVTLYHEIHYIEELFLEHEVEKVKGHLGSQYPVFVVIEMLSVLANYRLGKIIQYRRPLKKLHTMLLFDNRGYVPLFHRDISWQILGICQEVVGDLHGALYSFQESDRQKPIHEIQQATKTRIEYILQRLSRNIHL